MDVLKMIFIGILVRLIPIAIFLAIVYAALLHGFKINALEYWPFTSKAWVAEKPKKPRDPYFIELEKKLGLDEPTKEPTSQESSQESIKKRYREIEKELGL